MNFKPKSVSASYSPGAKCRGTALLASLDRHSAKRGGGLLVVCLPIRASERSREPHRGQPRASPRQTLRLPESRRTLSPRGGVCPNEARRVPHRGSRLVSPNTRGFARSPFSRWSERGASLTGIPRIIGRQNPLRCSKIATIRLPYMRKNDDIHKIPPQAPVKIPVFASPIYFRRWESHF